jgi:hypothetical protein
MAGVLYEFDFLYSITPTDAFVHRIPSFLGSFFSEIFQVLQFFTDGDGGHILAVAPLPAARARKIQGAAKGVPYAVG